MNSKYDMEIMGTDQKGKTNFLPANLHVQPFSLAITVQFASVDNTGNWQKHRCTKFYIDKIFCIFCELLMLSDIQRWPKTYPCTGIIYKLFLHVCCKN